MPCYYPRPMFEQVNSEGVVFFHLWKPHAGLKILKEFPSKCGQCSGCRATQVREKGVRCYHESLSHVESSFITLTVEENFMDFVFPGRSLRYEPFQLFLKRFRKAVKVPIRFYMCAEYGDNFERPHYHAIIFGWMAPPEDRTLLKRTDVGDIFTSDILESCWTFGYSSIAYFSIDTAFYVAGYINKKINGLLKDKWYDGRTAEFSHSSNDGGRRDPSVERKGGIGFGFYKKFTSDLYRRDKVELPGGFKMPIPRYYDKLHGFYHPGHMDKVRLARLEPNPVRDALNVPERLAARKVISEQRLKMKRRSFEKGDLS